MDKRNLDITTLYHVQRLIKDKKSAGAAPASYHSAVMDGFNMVLEDVNALIEEAEADKRKNSYDMDIKTLNGLHTQARIEGEGSPLAQFITSYQNLLAEHNELKENYRLICSDSDCLSDIINKTDEVGIELAKMCGEDLDGISQFSEPSIYIMGFFEKVKKKYDNLEMYLKQSTEDFECLPGCDSYGHEELCPVTNTMEAFRKVYAELKKYKNQSS